MQQPLRFLYVIPSFASSVREKYRRDDGYHPFAESERPFSVPSHLKNFRFRCHQFLVSLLLVFLLGACVQVHKLSALDAAGREFQQTKTSDKTMFLVPFALVFGVAGESIRKEKSRDRRVDVFGGGADVGDVGGDDEDRERKRGAEMEQNRSFWVFFRRRSRNWMDDGDYDER
jgi:hypothetical protein